MNQALHRATYYFQGNDDSYLKYNIVRELMYDGTKENLSNTINTFQSDIKIRNIFGHTDIYYQIADLIPKIYEKLLLSQVDVILIVTRYDQAIKIVKKYPDNNNNDIPSDLSIAIIKLDSVIAESKLSSINDGIWYGIYLGVFIGIGLLCKKVYNENKILNNVFFA